MVGTGFLVAHVVTVLATFVWVSSGSGTYTTGALARLTMTGVLLATVVGAAVAGLVARRVLASATCPARVATAAGAGAYATVTALVSVLGGALGIGLATLVAGPVVAAATTLLVIRQPTRGRA